MTDRVARGWVGEGGARVLIVNAPGIAAETATRHGLDEAAAQRAAELVVANVLLGAWIKGEERSTLQVSGEGWSFYGEIDAVGQVRARLQPPSLVTRQARFDGVMLVLKYDAVRELYRGTTSVVRATVEGALQRHLAQSDQVDVGVRILVDERGARGMIVERMPADAARAGLDDVAWSSLRHGAARVDPVDVLRTSEVLGRPVAWLEERPLFWRCRCTDDSVRAMLVGLGNETLLELINEDHGAEVTCHFCNTARQFSEQDLLEMLTLGDA